MLSVRRLAVAFLFALLTSAPFASRAEEATLTARLEAMANDGNAEAAYHLGMIYHLGLEGVPRDYQVALDYFRRAAEAGDPLGTYKLGCYYAGQGGGIVAEDEALALRYKLIAAEAGYDLAQVDVAQIYHARGEYDRALHWLEAAARQGNMQAITLAIMYRATEGPRPDGARAWLYFELMRRDLARMLETLDATERPSPEEEEAAIEEATVVLRRQLLPNESEADRARGAALIAEWREERSPLSLKADEGLDAARRLLELSTEGGDTDYNPNG